MLARMPSSLPLTRRMKFFRCFQKMSATVAAMIAMSQPLRPVRMHQTRYPTLAESVPMNI